jgi:hypothetical protein
MPSMAEAEEDGVHRFQAMREGVSRVYWWDGSYAL